MVMVSCPELVCAVALDASRQSRPPIMSRAFIPSNLKLQLIVNKTANSKRPYPFLTCDIHHCPLDLSWQNVLVGRALLPKVQSVAGLGTLVFRDASSLSGSR